MLNTDKTGILQAFLGRLPGHVAARLAMAVETDRLMDGRALPHHDILNGLRPVLRSGEEFQRTLTPLRLFCRPFQDLLTCTPRQSKQKGRIARGTLVPAWNWISQSLLPAEAAVYVREAKALVLAQRDDAAVARVGQFWPLASAAMREALKDINKRKLLERMLGDAMAVEDADEMALLLAAGETIEKLSQLLPKPAAFNEQLLWDVRGIYDTLVQSQPDVAPYVAVIAMNRLAKPWEALRLPIMISRKHDETLISKTDMGLVGEILFDRMDTLKTSIQAARHPLFDADLLMEEVKAFADLSSHIVKEIELKREGEWGKRLLAERVGIGKVMENFMDRAPREFNAALPMSKGKGADFTRHPGAEKQEMAKRYARLVAGSRNFAAAASFAAKQKTTYDELCTTLKRYNEDLVTALKTDHAHAEIVHAQFELCAELTAILFSEDEAAMLRRRAKAAQAAA